MPRLKLNPQWGETPQSLLQRSLEAETKILRERFLALHFIASGLSATQAAQKLGRARQTVAAWVRCFNRGGPEALVPKWRGRPGKRLSQEELEQLREVVRRPPRAVGIKAGRWTARLVAAYVQRTFGKRVHPETARRYLHELGFGLKMPRKRLVKADRAQQEAFIRELQAVEAQRSPHSLTVYMDEGQIEQDANLKRMWVLKGEEAVVDSTSPGKKSCVSMLE